MPEQPSVDPRWTKEEFENELMKFYKREPEFLTEAEFKDHISHTSVYRYDKGNTLLKEVESEILRLANEGKISSVDADIIISKIDRSVVSFAYGALRYNSTLAAGATKRPELRTGQET